MNRRRGDSPSMRAPSAPRTRVPRTALSLALCLLLPPIGLAYLWRLGVFRPRGRMLLTALATVEMAVFAALMMPRATLESAPLPVPGTPARVTPAPEGEVRTALSNIDEILRAEQTPAPDTGDEPSLISRMNAEQDDAILDTIVYAVYGDGARYYHSQPVCGNQSNRRALTLGEAIAERLGACPDCDPPVYTRAIPAPTATPGA